MVILLTVERGEAGDREIEEVLLQKRRGSGFLSVFLGGEGR